MSIVRGWALALALLFGALLLWVIILTFTQSNLVVPSVSVRSAGSASAPQVGGSSASEILRQRTRLQGGDAVRDGDRVVQLERSAGEITFHQGGVEAPRSLVQNWSERPSTGTVELLKPSVFRSGVTSLPYRQANVLVQPSDRDFRSIRNGPVNYGGAWLLVGTLFALALFLFWRGRIKIVEGESGTRILRFTAIELANHWMTSSAFVLMALSGLIILYGKFLLLPWMSGSIYSSIASASAWLHMASAAPFVLGIGVMIVLWLRANIPNSIDWRWLKRGGGFLHDDGNNPPAEKFNAGQKIVFWGVVIGGLLMTLTGLSLMYPFLLLGYAGMEIMTIAHAAIGLAMIALIFGHIYIGTVGMVGAIDAMWSGFVDRNWAKEHHKIWFDRVTRISKSHEADLHPDVSRKSHQTAAMRES